MVDDIVQKIDELAARATLPRVGSSALSDADVDFLSALVNAWPQISDELSRLRAENDYLKECGRQRFNFHQQLRAENDRLRAENAHLGDLRFLYDGLKMDVEALKRVASAARSLMSEDGAREEMACYNALFILDDALRALPEHLK